MVSDNLLLDITDLHLSCFRIDVDGGMYFGALHHQSNIWNEWTRSHVWSVQLMRFSTSQAPDFIVHHLTTSFDFAQIIWT